LIREELPRIVAETQSTGRTPDYTLSKELQQLREAGIIEFLSRGRYRLLKSVVEAETFDGNNQELDAAIVEGRFRIGRIEAVNELTVQKRRRGQQRLRRLALGRYAAQCALCDMKEKPLLVASHIVPWAESEDGRGDLCNVIILCRPHDSLFEFGYWSLSDDFVVLRRRHKRNPWVIDALLPDSIAFRAPLAHSPSNDYLRIHRERHEFA
jgi:hypothetical protein